MKKIALFLIFISLTLFAFSQSKKARKAHEAIQKNEFTKAKDLISEIGLKNEEIVLFNFLNYEYYFNTGNQEFHLDSAYFYLIKAKYTYISEPFLDKLKESYLKDFSFDLSMTEIQFDSIFLLAYKNAQKSKNISEYNHFIKYFNENKYTTIAVKELDTLQFYLYESYNSMDSLYKFKTRFINSKLFSETDELIVSMKIKLCKYKPSIECFESIIKEFPKCRRALVIQTEINIIQDSIASNDFTKCKSQKSIECLVQIKRKYPKASIIKEVNDEIDNLNYSNYVSSMRLDSIALFLTNFVNSKKIVDAQQTFTKIFEDSIKIISALRENEYYLLNYQELKNSFFPLVQLYYSFNNNNSQIKESIEDFVYMSIKDDGGIEGLTWFINEFPNSSKINIAKAEIKNQKSKNNLAFEQEIKSSEPYSGRVNYEFGKFGLLNMTSASLKFGYFFDDVKSFEGGLAAVKLFGKWGFINLQGDVEIPFLFDDVKSFNAPITGVCQEGVWFLIDKTGFRVSDNEYLKIGDFGNGICNVMPFSGGWQYINEIEEVVSTINYYNATNFINGIAAVSTKDGEILIIDKTFRVLNDISDNLTDYIPDYDLTGSSTKNIVTFEYCDKIDKYLINAQVYYSAKTNSTKVDAPASAIFFSSNDMVFDDTGEFLIDGRRIINYRSNDPKFKYAYNSKEIKIILRLNGLDYDLYRNYTNPIDIRTGFHPKSPLQNLTHIVNYYDNLGLRQPGPDWYENGSVWMYGIYDFKPLKSPYLSTFSLMNNSSNSNLLKSSNLVAFNDESIVVSDAMGYNLILPSGELLNQTGSFQEISVMSNGIAIVNSTAGLFLINSKGEKTSKLFGTIDRISDNVFIASNKGEYKYFIMDDKGNELSAYYDIIDRNSISNLFIVKNKNGTDDGNQKYKIGCIDPSGKEIIPPIYDDLIHVPSQFIFKKCTDWRNCSYRGSYYIYNYSGQVIETISDYNYSYSHTNLDGSFFYKDTYKPNTEGEIIKRVVYNVPLDF